MPRWTEEARAKQAEIARNRKMWEQSTGPKTDAGKDRSKWNAYKHGCTSERALMLHKIMKMQSLLLSGALNHCENTENNATISLSVPNDLDTIN
jgi:hypothetical protein